MVSEPEFRIIVIDDNPAIHEDFKKILSNDIESIQLNNLKKDLIGSKSEAEAVELPNFQIDIAEQGQEGFERIKKALTEGKPYALAFVDVRMPPGWDGVETIKHIWALNKDIQVVICTAYSDYSWEETVASLGMTDSLLILKKPFDTIAVRQLACAMTKKWQLMQDTKIREEFLEKTIQERTSSLQKSLSLTRATLESSSNGTIVADNNGHLVDYNQAFLEMLAVSDALIKENDYKKIQDYLLKQLKFEGPFEEFIERFRKRPDESGEITLELKDTRYLECYSQPQLLEGVNVGRVWSFRDITKRVILEERLAYQATHDYLTSLPNRALLINRLQNEIDRAKRDGKIFAVMFFDLDRFKLINDSLGHDVGDELLLGVSDRLRSIKRMEDTIARLSGDEFILVSMIPTTYQQTDVMGIGKRILDTLSNSIKIKNRTINITASMGISLYPKDGANPIELLRHADLAMYHAKSSGGNQMKFYSPELTAECKNRFEKEADLRRGFQAGEFFLEYQPQYDVHNKQIVSVEALVRWKHPTQGILLPMDFIPLAEECGLIVLLGEWILRTACKQNKTWQDQGFGYFRVGVNIATKQFLQPDFSLLIQNILKETGLEAKYLEVEVTENVIITNNKVIDTIVEIKKLGVQIVLDDFGTGNAGFNQLRSVPIDQLKIDQTFIKNVNSNRADAVIIQAIVSMANSLSMEVVAEGIENENQLNFLEAHNCKKFQGYYFSSPVTARELEKLLKK